MMVTPGESHSDSGESHEGKPQLGKGPGSAHRIVGPGVVLYTRGIRARAELWEGRPVPGYTRRGKTGGRRVSSSATSRLPLVM